MRLFHWLFKGGKPLSQMDIYEIAESHRARFLDGEAKAVARIRTSYEEAEKGLKKSLADVEAKIAAYYASGGEPGAIAASWLVSQERYHALISQIDAELEKFAAAAQEITLEGQKTSLKQGAADVTASAKSQMQTAGISGSFHSLHSAAFEEMAGTLSNGSALYDLFKQIAPNAVASARGVLGQAMVEGWNPRKTGAALEDSLGMSKNRAVLIARTESIRAYRIASQRQMLANQDVVDGWVWYASHTDHTCPVCLAMDGSEHPVNEIMDSHPACRCTMVPLVKSLAGIVSEGEGQEAAEDGELNIPSRETGSNWFGNQSEDLQRRALGPAKFDLYKAGKIDLDDLVENTYDNRWGKSKRERSLKSLLQMVDAGTTHVILGAKLKEEAKAKADAKLVAHAQAVADKLAKIEAKKKHEAEKAAAEAQVIIDKEARAVKKAQKVADEAKAAKEIQDDHTIKLLDSLEAIAQSHGGNPSFDVKGYFKAVKDAYPHADVTAAEMQAHWTAHAPPPPEAITKDLGYPKEETLHDGSNFKDVEVYVKYLIKTVGEDWTPAQIIAKAKAEWKTDKTGYNAKGILSYAKKLGITMPEAPLTGKATPKAPTVVPNTPPPANPLKIEGWKLDPEAVVLGGKMTAGQGGSNPGGYYTGTDGGKYYVKFYKDAAQAYNEHLANTIYRDLGINAADTTVFKDAQGRTVYVSKIIENEGTLGSNFSKARAETILNGYAADVFLANWDVVGLTYDNIVKLKGDAVARIDNGGSLLYRAKEGRKPVDRLAKLDEWEFFSTKNSKYSAVFENAGVYGGDDLGARAIKQIEAIEALGSRPGGWRKFVDEQVTGMDQADRDFLVKTLETRQFLLKQKRIQLAEIANAPTPTYSTESIHKVKNFGVGDANKLNTLLENNGQKYLAGQEASIWNTQVWAVAKSRFQQIMNEVSKWTGSSNGHAFHDAAQGQGPVAQDLKITLATRRERWDKLVSILGLEAAPKSFTLYRGNRGADMVKWVTVAWQDESKPFMRVLSKPTASWSTHTKAADRFYGESLGVKWKAEVPLENTFFDKWVDDHTFISSFWGENEVIAGGGTRNAIACKKEDVVVRLNGKEYTYAERKAFFAAYEKTFGKLPTIDDITEDPHLNSMKKHAHGDASLFGG